MTNRLAELAEEIEECRRRWNQRTLDYVLESARILAQAKAIAKGDFGRWVQTQAHMDISTAERHLRVARLVERNSELMPKIATLNVSKLYVLTGLDSAVAKKILSGEIRLSRPPKDLGDIEFKTEIRETFPPKPKRRTRVHAFRAVLSALHRAERELHRSGRFARKMTPGQRRRIFDRISAVSRLSTLWAEGLYRATKS